MYTLPLQDLDGSMTANLIPSFRDKSDQSNVILYSVLTYRFRNLASHILRHNLRSRTHDTFC